MKIELKYIPGRQAGNMLLKRYPSYKCETYKHIYKVQVLDKEACKVNTRTYFFYNYT